ncbi:MAG: hypothetical protein LBU73_06050 [Helicobacteraceae bacterium]|jgi:hypothetical protein|nr:hypothetical protein [Helicobacteraceae bacterium]
MKTEEKESLKIKTREEILELVGELIIEARNSGINTFQNIRNGEWIPKNPNVQEKNTIKLINSLNQEQSEIIENVIGYLIDLSVFKLLNILENGFKDYDFDLSIKNENQRIFLTGENSEIEISSEFWQWLSKYGIKGTVPW